MVYSFQGVCIPTRPEVYEPVLSELEGQGIGMIDKNTANIVLDSILIFFSAVFKDKEISLHPNYV